MLLVPTVTAGCLRAVGAQSRDAETRRLGAGHVLVEAWLEDRRCWVFVDPELDVVGVAKDGTPLDAVAFRQALALPDPQIDRPASLAMCMYHFTTSLDQRHPINSRSVGDAMLAPVGVEGPRACQREPAASSALLVHNAADFHAEPRVNRWRSEVIHHGSDTRRHEPSLAAGQAPEANHTARPRGSAIAE